MKNQKYDYIPESKSMEKIRQEIEQVLQYKCFGFSYCFKKYMNPNRSYKELDQFLMHFFYGTTDPYTQNPTTYIVTGIDQIDFMAFASLMNKEAGDRGFTCNIEEGMIVPSKDDNSYKPNYIVYHLHNGYRLIITAAGFDFDIEKYINE